MEVAPWIAASALVVNVLLMLRCSQLRGVWPISWLVFPGLQLGVCYGLLYHEYVVHPGGFAGDPSSPSVLAGLDTVFWAGPAALLLFFLGLGVDLSQTRKRAGPGVES